MEEIKTKLNEKTGQIEQQVLIGANYIFISELKEMYGDLLDLKHRQKNRNFWFILNFIMHDDRCPEIKIPKFKGRGEMYKWYKDQIDAENTTQDTKLTL